MPQPQFFYSTEHTPKALDGYTLILPSISVGNVGQLTIDILLSTLLEQNKIQLIGRMISTSLRPIVGCNSFRMMSSPDDTCTTACELYADSTTNTAIMQIRSYPFEGCERIFFKEITAFINDNKFGRVVLVSSSYDCVVRGRERHTVKCLTNGKDDSSFCVAGIPRIEKVAKYTLIPTTSDEGVYNIPGSGYVKGLLRKAEMPILSLVKFCSEGDNSFDALDLINYVNNQLPSSLQQPTWNKPISWREMFGETPLSDLF